jgi:predicted XRE-type DNA-binding protein
MTDEPRFVESSGNVFADLGLPDAETRLAKAELARRIALEIEERKLKQREAAEFLISGCEARHQERTCPEH